MNLLSLVSLWLDNNCQIKNENTIVAKFKKFRELSKAYNESAKSRALKILRFISLIRIAITYLVVL